MKTPTDKQVADAVDILEARGRAMMNDPDSISRGEAIGNGLYTQLGPEEVVAAAMSSFEQWNGHLSVAAIQAIEKDKTFARTGRDLHITLPEYWGKPPLG